MLLCVNGETVFCVIAYAKVGVGVGAPPMSASSCNMTHMHDSWAFMQMLFVPSGGELQLMKQRKTGLMGY